MKYFIRTYGCQMNVHESEKIAGILEKCGYEPSADQSKADVYVFNTCCIRETAEQKIYGHLGQVKKLKQINPELIVAVCGCMSQQDGVASKIRESYPFVDIILGTGNLNLLDGAIEKIKKDRKSFCDSTMYSVCEEDYPLSRTSYPNAWVNINYGCNNFCTYCIVPYVRGRERSRPLLDIVSEVTFLIGEGYKEITLLGQNVNSYGKDFEDGTDFASLLNRIGELSGKFRIRFMTSHPKDLSEAVIDAIKNNVNVCNCIHLPVQSGSSEILRRMNRRYNREDYLSLIERIRDKIPDVGITTDIMVGFPGESEDDFSDTINLVEKVRFSSAFCFIYSRRKGTPAYSMDEQIPYSVKSRRISSLIAVQNVVTKEISRQMQGKTYELLVDGTNDKYDSTYCGRTENGRLVNFKSAKENLIGSFVDVVIDYSRSATLWGHLTAEE